ncbi:MAG: hydrogenase small subunit, partial [Rhodoferax sp.]
MKMPSTVFDSLQQQGVSRRSFLKFCSVTASSLGIAATGVTAFAQALGAARRPSVIWMSFQHCTGCSESLMRSGSPLTDRLTVENLILNFISLDYHETLQVAAGAQAEEARLAAMKENFGNYILIVDGSLPTAENEWWLAVAGQSGLSILHEAIAGAGLVLALGACATYGGIPAAFPNPSKAMGVGELMDKGLIGRKPLINISGCPPIPEVITGTIAYYLVNQAAPPLDALGRPLVFFGKTVHDCCPRLD